MASDEKETLAAMLYRLADDLEAVLDDRETELALCRWGDEGPCE